MKAYKVCGPDPLRLSSNFAAFLCTDNLSETQKEVEEIINFRLYETTPKLSFNKYCKSYIKGAEVKADKDTAGILCFKTIDAASLFLQSYQDLRQGRAQIVEVVGTRIRKRVNLVFAGQNINDLFSYITNKRKDQFMDDPPAGTISFSKVKVLT